MTALQSWLLAGCQSGHYTSHPEIGPCVIWRTCPAGSGSREVFNLIGVGFCEYIGGRRALLHEFRQRRKGRAA